MSNGNIRHVEATFDMLLQHVEFDMLFGHVAAVTCRKDKKIARDVAKNGNMSNGNIRHVEATFDMSKQPVKFDMLLRHVAGVDGA